MKDNLGYSKNLKSLCSLSGTIAILLFIPIILTSCGPRALVAGDALCEPFGNLRVFCEIQSPEDLVMTPDGKHMLISEKGVMGIEEGRISLLAADSGEVFTLYDSGSSNDLKNRITLWGDLSCEEPSTFSPHGIDLYQRPSGRWQLLVVNHGEHESVEMFELVKPNDFGWELIWRGCVKAEEDSLFSDVAGLNNGFVVTQLRSRKAKFHGVLDYLFELSGGSIWRWRLNDGLRELPNSSGSLLNGIVSDADNGRYFVNFYGEGKIKIYDARQNKYVNDIDIAGADNTNWDLSQPERVLIASHDFNLSDIYNCFLGWQKKCAGAFNIIEMNTKTLQHKIIFKSDGDYFGGGSSAIRINDTLYIGAFSGERLLLAPVGYGVNE